MFSTLNDRYYFLSLEPITFKDEEKETEQMTVKEIREISVKLDMVIERQPIKRLIYFCNVLIMIGAVGSLEFSQQFSCY